jgi:hypothetical protein
MKPKVSIGATTVVGWLTALVGLLPIIVKSIESGTTAFNGPEKWLAVAGVIFGSITQVFRYAQSLKL